MDITRMACAGLLAALSGVASAARITVNTATDDFGSVTTNCSLREAVQSANLNSDFGGCTHTGFYGDAFLDTIELPTLAAGAAFTLTRIGTDDTNVAGDLDLVGRTTIEGVNATNSVIRGDTGDPDSDRHRLVHVISGNVMLRDLTLRDGLEDNQGAGGGLRTEPGTTTTLRGVVVTANEADGNAGGILNRGTMTINDSTVSNNLARRPSDGGGGVFNSPGATLTINDSIVRDNRATGNVIPVGGGLFNDAGATLVVDNSVVHGNVADGTTELTDSSAFGGGIWSPGALTLVQCSITANETRGKNASGAGVHVSNLEVATLIDRCVISGNVSNSTDNVGTGGGGLRTTTNTSAPLVEIRDSVISGNRAENGGGVSGRIRLVRSTIASNVAEDDGGGLELGSGSQIVNSTIIGNQAASGGGISAGSLSGGSFANILVNSSTIVGNAATGGLGEGRGGGLHLFGGVLELASTVVAGNSADNALDECALHPNASGSSAILSSGHNLIQDTAECDFIDEPSDVLDQNAALAAAANNGGAVAGSSLGVISGMLTRAPLPTSPLLDRGNPGGCVDANGTALATDQVGSPRAIDGPDPDATARCDIGAIERVDVLFRDGFDP